MVLESVMICLDNSEAMRNGDYSPNRFDAMVEAVNEIANAKLNDNAETTVGVLSMANTGIEVHVAPTRSLGAIMTTIQKEVRIGGESNFIGALKTAHLVLKNRPNKSQRQRIIMFVGSPLMEDERVLERLGKMFKKNNVAVDIVNFGTENCSGAQTRNPELLELFVQTVNSSDNSRLVHIPPGPSIFSDLVLTSAIMMDGEAHGRPAGAAGVGLEAGLDPELEMVLRLSREEERQRQEAAAAERAAEGQAAGAQPIPMDEDEDALLQQAIAMSMQSAGIDAAVPMTPATERPAEPSHGAHDSGRDDEDVAQALQDPDFVTSLLDSIPGVSSEEIPDILNQLTEGDKAKEADKKDDEGNKS